MTRVQAWLHNPWVVWGAVGCGLLLLAALVLLWVRRRDQWRWADANELLWYRQWRNPPEFKTWFIEAKKRQGKTRYMAREAVRDMRRGIRVASNFTIRDRVTGQSSECCKSWIDVLRLSVDALGKSEPIKFYIDEIHLWLDSRSFKSTPQWFRGWLAQSGHYGAGICGSVQNLRRLEIVARELVDELLVIRKFYFRVFLLPIEAPWNPIIPLQWVGVVDEDSLPTSEMGEATAYRYKRSGLTFPRWWAGYDTRELIQVEPWTSDEALDAEVARLTDEAAALVAPGVIASYSDELERRQAAARFHEAAALAAGLDLAE